MDQEDCVTVWFFSFDKTSDARTDYYKKSVLSPDKTRLFLCTDKMSCVLDTKDGRIQNQFSNEEDSPAPTANIIRHAVMSPDNQYAAVLLGGLGDDNCFIRYYALEENRIFQTALS